MQFIKKTSMRRMKAVLKWTLLGVVLEQREVRGSRTARGVEARINHADALLGVRDVINVRD
jgi:hypothetical protein